MFVAMILFFAMVGLSVELKADIPDWLLPIPLVLSVVFRFWAEVRKKRERIQAKERTWAARDEMTRAAPTPMLPASPSQLARLQRTDPAFSIIVFEDFFDFLYAEMHRTRAASNLDVLGSYLSDAARAALRSDGRIAEITDIVIGTLAYVDILVNADGAATVTVTVESSYVEHYHPGEQHFFVKEMITLTRAAGARSRTPDKARTLNRPSGTEDWAITTVVLLGRNTLGPIPTSADAVQRMNAPTMVDPNAHAVFVQIQARDPTFTWGYLEQRIVLIFQALHSHDLARMRPFLSHNSFQSQLYWADLYRTAECIHPTDGAHITFMELASATIDAYYDSVTVRVYSSGLDYTTAGDGRLLSGSQQQPRGDTNDWTLIRDTQSGNDDWILSRIEQIQGV